MTNPAPRRPLRATQITLVAAILVVVLGFVAAIAWHQQPEHRVARLIQTLQEDRQAAHRGKAARDLGDMGPVARSAVPALAKALGDDGQYLTPGILIPGEHWVYQDAFAALKHLGGRETAEAMVDVIRHAGEHWRQASLAAQVLVAMEREAASVTPQLVGVLRDCRDGEIVKNILAVLVINAPAPGSPEASELASLLPRFVIMSGSEARRDAAWLGRKLAASDDEAIGRLIDATQTQDVYTAAIGEWVKEYGPRAIPELVRRLGHPNHPALVTLLQSYSAAEVLLELGEAIRSSETLRQRAASQVVARMRVTEGDLELIRNFARELKSEETEARAGFCVAILRRDPDSKETAATLIELTGIQPADCPFAAPALYGEISFNDSWAVPWLEQSLAAEAPATRIHAATALARFGPAARPALPALLKALQDDDEDVRKAAAKAVAAIDL